MFAVVMKLIQVLAVSSAGTKLRVDTLICIKRDLD